jgi:hypothetical protein
VAVGARAAATAYGWWSGRGEELLCWCWCRCRWRTTDGKYGGEVTGDDDEEDTAGLVRRRKAPRDLGLESGRENEDANR